MGFVYGKNPSSFPPMGFQRCQVRQGMVDRCATTNDPHMLWRLGTSNGASLGCLGGMFAVDVEDEDQTKLVKYVFFVGQCSWPTAHRTPWAFVHILTFHLILHTCWMLRNWSGVGGGGGMITFLALCTHVGCYATGQGWGGGG